MMLPSDGSALLSASRTLAGVITVQQPSIATSTTGVHATEKRHNQLDPLKDTTQKTRPLHVGRPAKDIEEDEVSPASKNVSSVESCRESSEETGGQSSTSSKQYYFVEIGRDKGGDSEASANILSASRIKYYLEWDDSGSGLAPLSASALAFVRRYKLQKAISGRGFSVKHDSLTQPYSVKPESERGSSKR